MTSSQLKRILSLWLEIDQSLQASSDLKQALIDFNLSNFAAFDNGKIRLVDFGSIQSCEDPYTGILDIITKGLPVLKIKALSPDLEMSSIYHEWIENSSTRHGVSMSSPIADITNWLELDFTYRSTRQDITKNIEDWLSKIETPDRRDFWSTYGSGLTYGSVRDLQLDPPESEKLQARSLTRVETVISILSSMPRGSLLDLGCARGMFSEQAAAMGFAVVALDGCESSISEIDTRLEGHRELNLVALPATFLPDNLHSPNFDSTWQFDVVLCLALSHHLLLGEFSAVQRKSFSVQELAEMLHRVCRRNLLVEFMEHGLGSPINNMANVPNPLPDWYTLENLESHLSDYFQVIERVRYEEEQQRHRTLLVCEKQPIL
jgi:2-polyprenyl-3-methyl-5-hydroxy-6-metoxy-1,4-benzoquinol methylase